MARAWSTRRRRSPSRTRYTSCKAPTGACWGRWPSARMPSPPCRSLPRPDIRCGWFACRSTRHAVPRNRHRGRRSQRMPTRSYGAPQRVKCRICWGVTTTMRRGDMPPQSGPRAVVRRRGFRYERLRRRLDAEAAEADAQNDPCAASRGRKSVGDHRDQDTAPPPAVPLDECRGVRTLFVHHAGKIRQVMTERILTVLPCKKCRRGTKQRTGTIYKEQQRNTGHRSNSGGRHCGVQYVRGVGRVVRSRWVAEISVHGKRYRFRSTSYDNCRWWIRMMVEKYEND